MRPHAHLPPPSPEYALTRPLQVQLKHTAAAFVLWLLASAVWLGVFFADRDWTACKVGYAIQTLSALGFVAAFIVIGAWEWNTLTYHLRAYCAARARYANAIKTIEAERRERAAAPLRVERDETTESLNTSVGRAMMTRPPRHPTPENERTHRSSRSSTIHEAPALPLPPVLPAVACGTGRPKALRVPRGTPPPGFQASASGHHIVGAPMHVTVQPVSETPGAFQVQSRWRIDTQTITSPHPETESTLGSD